jgi:hypothetical protein
MQMTKKTLELNERIVTQELPAGGWVSRLEALDIETHGATHDDAQSAAFHLMLEKLAGMGPDESKAWIELNAAPCSPDDVPDCSVDAD